MIELTNYQKAVAGSAIRWALTAIFGGLATHKVVDGSVLGLAIDQTTAQIVGSLGVGITLIWSQLQKWWAEHRARVAAVAPVGSTTKQIDAVVAVSPTVVPTPTQAAAIVAAVAPIDPHKTP